MNNKEYIIELLKLKNSTGRGTAYEKNVDEFLSIAYSNEQDSLIAEKEQLQKEHDELLEALDNVCKYRLFFETSNDRDTEFENEIQNIVIKIKKENKCKKK